MERMLGVLKELAEKYRSEIIENTRKQLLKASDEGVLRLFDHVFNFYYGEEILGRWYDPYHVAYSTFFASAVVDCRYDLGHEASPLIVPAIILHDIGYHSPLVDEDSWFSKNSRIIHMQEGAAMAAEILTGILEFGYTRVGDVEKIVGMVASHDNGYLGISTRDRDRLVLRDADRVWVMHPLSFYKDWITKIQKGEKISPLDLFRSRLTSFYGPKEAYPSEWGKAITLDKEDAVQSPPFCESARWQRDEQFASRFQEISDNIVCDVETFRKTIENNIQSELATDRARNES